MTTEEYAKIAFEAYSESTGGKTYDGKPIPKWNELPEHVQRAWSAAAAAIINKLSDRVREMFAL